MEQRKTQNNLKQKLSFQLDDEEEEEEVHGEEIIPNFGKDPTTDTHFLPDKLRDEKDIKEQEQKEQQWKEEQEKLKSKFFITNSFKSKYLSKSKRQRHNQIVHFFLIKSIKKKKKKRKKI